MSQKLPWNPMPHVLDINCPSCGKPAIFEFAETVRIALKQDIVFFQDSDLFECRRFQDSCGHYWHGAVFYALLHGGSTAVIEALPKGYLPAQWDHPSSLTRHRDTPLGAYRCGQCHEGGTHTLDWPHDAQYSMAYKGHVLWAFNRDSAVALRDFLSSNHRSTVNSRWQRFLSHVPTRFKDRKARARLVQLIERLLVV